MNSFQGIFSFDNKYKVYSFIEEDSKKINS